MTPTLDMKTALIVEGGGMRGIYTAGVLDSFLNAGYDPFDMYFGVSVGASTLSSFLAGQRKRHYRIFTQIACGSDLFSLKRMMKGGHYMDLDWLWDTVESSLPLDTEAIDNHLAADKQCYIVCTRVDTGMPEYLSPKGREWIDILKATSALPILYRDFPMIFGTPMVDGGITDPLPVKAAYDKGARRVVIIRTRPCGVYKTARISPYLGSLFFRKHPELKQQIRNQELSYNTTLDFLSHPPEDLIITQISPRAPLKSTRTSTRRSGMIEDYIEGVETGEAALKALFRKHDRVDETGPLN